MITDITTLFTVEALLTLVMLVFLQAVLGFDNLLYISIESKRVEEDRQAYVRKLGIGLAIILRIVLLFVVLFAIEKLQAPLFQFGLKLDDNLVTAVHDLGTEAAPADDAVHQDVNPDLHEHYSPTSTGSIFAGRFNVHAIIVLLGGMFIIYTAFKEIHHMLSLDDLGEHNSGKKMRSVNSAIFWIVIMNLVFSFDSILSAIALTKNVWVMGIAIIASGLGMIWLADHVSQFLKKNRMYEVLGLFILLIVGVMLVSEGGHLASLHLFGYEITPMEKSTFYFVIAIMVLIDLAQSRYQKKLLAQRAMEMSH